MVAAPLQIKVDEHFRIVKICEEHINFRPHLSPHEIALQGLCFSGGLWLRTSPVHSQVVLHNKDIICYFGSLLVNSGRFQLASTIPTTILLVELVYIKHGCHIAARSYWQL